jgi:hypothetical protein
MALLIACLIHDFENLLLRKRVQLIGTRQFLEHAPTYS